MYFRKLEEKEDVKSKRSVFEPVMCWQDPQEVFLWAKEDIYRTKILPAMLTLEYHTGKRDRFIFNR